MQVSAAGFAQRITFKQKNTTLASIWSEITRQTGYEVFYSKDKVDANKKLDASFNNVDLRQVLEICITKQGLSYNIEDNVILIKPKAPSLLERITARFTAINVHGRIIDRQGQPLQGASIKVKGSRQATTTDADGGFYLKGLEDNAVLEISFIGYVTREVKASEELGNVSLTMSDSKLDEIQVIGYGTTTRRLSTGNVSTVKASEIEKQPVNNIVQALQGRVPGLQITPLSGISGAAPKVQIRGINSLGAGSSALYIVDGIPIPETQNAPSFSPLDGAPLSNLLGINPSEIEQIDVLKDADATSIYGSRGANGVVLITTKRGSRDGLKVNLNAHTGVQQVGHFIDFFDVHQYNSMRREALTNDGIAIAADNAPDLFNWDTTQVHNWQKELIGKTSFYHDVNLSVSGGNQNTQFYINAGYHKDGSVTPSNSAFNRKSFRANLNHQSVNRKFTLAASSSYTLSGLNLSTNSMVGFINLPPAYPIYNEDGTLNFDNEQGNPFALLRKTFQSPSRNYLGNLTIGYEVIKGLSLKLNAGYNNIVTEQSLIEPLSSMASTATSGSLRIVNNFGNTWIVEPQGSYEKVIGKNNFQLLAGSTFQRTNNSQLSITGTNYTNDALLNNIGAAGTKTVASNNSEYSYTSFFTRLTYNYDQRYLANISYRRDGSSRFGPGKRFGNFGSVGLGWIFSQESWVERILPILSFGKLRGSYGISGNDQIADYGYLSTYLNQTSSSTIYDGLTLASSRIANEDYRWEETKKFETAIELGFIKNRILLGMSVFNNRSGNQLVNYKLSPQTGFSGYQANFPAIVQNMGWEVTLTTINVKKGEFSWLTALNFSKSRNKLIKYDNIENSAYYSIYQVGKSLSLFNAFSFKGLSNTGIPILEDKNASGTINFEDATTHYDNDPLYGGISNEFSYKDFSFGFFVDYTRNSGSSNLLTGSFAGDIGINQSTFMLNRWRAPGDEKTEIMPRYTTSSSTYNAFQYYQTDIWYKTSHIFRLSNVTLGYQIPSGLLNPLKIKTARLYVNGQNLFVFDKYKKYRLDPLTGNTALPPLRTVVFGLNCSF